MTESPPTVRDAYDRWHAAHEPSGALDTPWYRLLQAAIRPDLDLAGRQVLEIGCGLGGLAVWLARHPSRPAQILAADFSPTAVGKARAAAAAGGVTGVEWVVADILDLSAVRGRFDTVISCETIEHVPDPPRAVAELAAALKPGGRLYLTTPNYLSAIGLYRAYCWARGKPFDEGGQPICHVTTILRTRSWVRQAGLRVVRTAAVGHYFPVPGRPPLRWNWLDKPHALTRWVGFHSLVVAERL